MMVDKTGGLHWLQQSITDISRNNSFKISRTTCCIINFCKYEGLCPATKTEIHRRCFQWNFAKFENSYFQE